MRRTPLRDNAASGQVRNNLVLESDADLETISFQFFDPYRMLEDDPFEIIGDRIDRILIHAHGLAVGDWVSVVDCDDDRLNAIHQVVQCPSQNISVLKLREPLDSATVSLVPTLEQTLDHSTPRIFTRRIGGSPRFSRRLTSKMAFEREDSIGPMIGFPAIQTEWAGEHRNDIYNREGSRLPVFQRSSIYIIARNLPSFNSIHTEVNTLRDTEFASTLPLNRPLSKIEPEIHEVMSPVYTRRIFSTVGGASSGATAASQSYSFNALASMSERRVTLNSGEAHLMAPIYPHRLFRPRTRPETFALSLGKVSFDGGSVNTGLYQQYLTNGHISFDRDYSNRPITELDTIFLECVDENGFYIDFRGNDFSITLEIIEGVSTVRGADHQTRIGLSNTN